MQPVEQLIEAVHLIEGIVEKKSDIGHTAHVLSDAGHKRLLEAGEMLIQFQQHPLFVFGIVNTEVYLGQVERPLIELALRETHGNQIKAARLLGLNRNTLRKKITEFQISVNQLKQSTAGKRKKTESDSV